MNYREHREKGKMEEIVTYIKKNLKKGYTRDSLKWALINQGYPRFEVEKALSRADMELASQAPVLKTKPEIKYEVIEPKSNPVDNKKPFWKRLFG